jgi:hypothetical protein
MIIRFLISVLALAVSFWSGCSPEPSYSFPHNFQQTNLPKLYLVNDSHREKITISADGTTIWRGVVRPSKYAPNIHTVGFPLASHRQCQISVTGGKYRSERSVDWQQGKALIVWLSGDGVVIQQKQEPVMFE